MRGARRGALALAAALWAVAAAAGASEAAWPDLSAPAATEGGGEGDAAVVIGIEDYVVVSDVPGARANAQDWYTWLVETRGVPVGSVVLLRDSEGTREGILDGARRARERVREGGTLWFVYIGHGAPGRDGTDGLLVGWDTQQTASSVYARGLAQSELLGELEQGPQATTLLLLDACFSGRTGAGDAIVHGLQPLIPDYSVQPRTATVVTAGRADQFAGPLPGAGRPAFSYLVLGALRGWGDADGDRQVSTQEAVDYAVSALYALVRDRTQTPELHGPGAATVLSRGQEAGPNLRELVVQLGPGGEAPTGPGATTPPQETSSSGGLMAELEELRRRQQQRGDELDAAVARARQEAAEAWQVTEQIARGGGAEGELALRKYVEAYDGHTVTVGGQTHPVTIEQVPRAKEWLARLERGEPTPPGDGAAEEPTPEEPAPPDGGGVDLTTPGGMLEYMSELIPPDAMGDEGMPKELYDVPLADAGASEATAYLQQVMALLDTGVPPLADFASQAMFFGSSAAEQERASYLAVEEAALAELQALPSFRGDPALRDAAVRFAEYGLSLTRGPCAEIVQLVRGAEQKGEMTGLVVSSIERRLAELEAEDAVHGDALLAAVEQFALQHGASLDAVFGAPTYDYGFEDAFDEGY